MTPAREDWLLLWSPERRAGWRHGQARVEDSGKAIFEEETTFLAPDGRTEGTVRLVEESGPGFAPLSFLLVEDLPGGSFTRIGRVAGGRLLVETFVGGEKTAQEFPLPDGFRLPLAARAAVLRDAGRDGASWKGPTFDTRACAPAAAALRVVRAERVPGEGGPVETVVLSREEGGRALEERVARDGRTLAADLGGAGLVGVGTTKARIDAFRAGTAGDADEDERKARMVFVSPEDGFRVRKPGVSWEFAAPPSREARERLVVRDLTGLVAVSVIVPIYQLVGQV